MECVPRHVAGRSHGGLSGAAALLDIVAFAAAVSVPHTVDADGNSGEAARNMAMNYAAAQLIYGFMPRQAAERIELDTPGAARRRPW